VSESRIDGEHVSFSSMYDREFSCPDISPLICLRVLSIRFGSKYGHENVDWACLCRLPSLQELTLNSTRKCLIIGQDLTMLAGLKCLTLIGAACSYSHLSVVVSLTLDVNWQAMQALQQLDLHSDSLLRSKYTEFDQADKP